MADSAAAAAGAFAAGSPALREVDITWNATLLVLSYIVSFLGAYASSQVCCQSSLCSRTSYAYYAWNALAAVLFGLCSVWSLHFLAMLAAQFEVKVSLSPGLTTFSAVIAVLFTWLALVSDSFTRKYIRRWKHKWRKSRFWRRKSQPPIGSSQSATTSSQQVTPSSEVPVSVDAQDLEAGIGGGDREDQPLLLHAESVLADDDERPVFEGNPENMTDLKRSLQEQSELRALAFDDTRMSIDDSESRASTPKLQYNAAFHPNANYQPHVTPNPKSSMKSSSVSPPAHNEATAQGGSAPVRTASKMSSRGATSFSFLSRKRSPEQHTSVGVSGGRASLTTGSSTDLTESSSQDDRPARRNSYFSQAFTSETGETSTGSTGSTSNSFIRGLPLTRREKSRLKAGAHTAMPLKELLLTLWGDCTSEAITKAGIWAMAICTMHYSGMSAFHLEQGYMKWNWILVVASAVLAWIVCLVGILFMPNMEVNVGRQLAFSGLAATGVFLMHMTGMSAATFYSSAPPTTEPGYPPALIYFITSFAILTCLISTTLISHAATLSRNKLVEMIHVKQQLWRTLAQKEAVEATVALQTEFTSVAAHELRTPLYTITGYIDLLSRTQMDDEQALYVETVRRACHTIQLITTNVLDFTRLERANDEAQARPVLVELRKFLLNLAEITEDRGPRLDQEDDGLELLVDIADDVPDSVYLDETYLTRVVMNLLNNAVKFCTQGYIRIAVEKDGEDIKLMIQDTGIGIPPRFLDRIFEPFRQADASLTRVNNGSGLGLAICKRLVARLNGEISVTSTEGEGSTFLVRIHDIQTGGRSSSNTAEVQQEVQQPAGRSMMIVVTNKRVQQALETAWARKGYKVLPRSMEAADMLKADFVWTDLPTIVHKESALLDLIKASPKNRHDEYPYIIVTYSTETELVHLPQSPFVMTVKRPLAIHELARILQLPKESLPTTAGTDKPKLVRFASTQSTTISEVSSSPPTSAGFEEDEEAVRDCACDDHEDDSSSHTVQEISSPSPPKVAEVAGPEHTGKKTVLLVEDNLVNSKLGQRMLIMLGYNVLVAFNGLEAFETVKLAHADIHAVLLDLQMPIMSGEESAALMRKYEEDNGLRRLPIIALSANVNTSSSTKILDAGADGFVGKPVSMKGLEEALHRYAGVVDE